jgi:hypothetical protein
MRVDRGQAAKARRRAVEPGGIETGANLQRIERRLELEAGHQGLLANGPEVRWGRKPLGKMSEQSSKHRRGE